MQRTPQKSHNQGKTYTCVENNKITLDVKAATKTTKQKGGAGENTAINVN